MIEILYRARGVWCTFVVLLFLLPGATFPASAQASPNWTVDNASNCWASWNKNFLYSTTINGRTTDWYATNMSGSASCGLWQEMNELQVVEDALDYATNYYAPSINYGAYTNEMNALCYGIDYGFQNQWSNAVPSNIGDSAPNDDLLWGAVAFARVYQATHNAMWLHQATNAFILVWTRAQINGDAAACGLGQGQNGGAPTNADCAVNFNCVIAGSILHNITGQSFYQNCADTIYKWAVTSGTNLYVPSNGKVKDSVRSNGPVDYSYNYGDAIWSAALEGDYNACTNMANYLMNNFVGFSYTYNGAWTDPGLNNETFHNLPDYFNDSGNFPTGTSGKNDAGFNGICYRGLGFAFYSGYLTSDEQQWVEEEVEAGFYYGDPATYLMWGDLQNPTRISSDLYSWDCSSQVAGILDIPPPAVVNMNPTNIVFKVTNNQISLSWPADHIGWQLQAQTNSISTGLNANWVNVSGSATTNQVIVPIGWTNGCVFYRLVFP